MGRVSGEDVQNRTASLRQNEHISVAAPTGPDDEWSWVHDVPESITGAGLPDGCPPERVEAFNNQRGPSATPHNLDSAVQEPPQQQISAEDMLELRDSAQTSYQLLAKLTHIRAQATLVLDEANYKAKSIQDHRRYVLESSQRLLKNLKSLDNVALPVAVEKQVHDDHQQVVDDLTNLDEQTETFHLAANRLGRLEFKLQEHETSVVQATHKMLYIFERLGLVSSTELPATNGPRSASASSQRSTQESAEPHPLIADYFDKVGNLKIVRERSILLALTHQDERTTRLFDADHDIPLEISDDAFEEAYQNDRNEAEEAVRSALHAVEKARTACLADGLDYEAARKQAAVDGSSSGHRSATFNAPGWPQAPSDIALDGLQQVPTIMPSVTPTERNASSALLVTPAPTGPMISGVASPRQTRRDLARKTRYVEEWIQDIEKDKNDTVIEQLLQKQVDEQPILPSGNSIESLPLPKHEDRSRTPELSPSNKSIPLNRCTSDRQNSLPKSASRPRSFEGLTRVCSRQRRGSS